MKELLQVRPDVTFAVDGQGMIRTAVFAHSLENEAGGKWQGLRWKDAVPAELVSEVERSVDEGQSSGASCFTINQRFPSGREFLIEYTTLSLGKRAGFVAIGKNLSAISELQSRLAIVQQERERDYWKFREIETRYRALLDVSGEAVLLVRATNLRVVEANAAATKLLGLVPGAEFYLDVPDRDRELLNATLEAVRMKGRTPGIALHLSQAGRWSLRGSMIASEAGAFYLLQMSPLLETLGPPAKDDRFSVEDLVLRMPDGFAVVDAQGVLRHANHTFADLVQVGVESAVVGQNAKRWLSSPGAGISVILDLVERHGSVRAMKTTLEGELGGNTDVEVSAVGDRIGRARYVGLVFRDVTLRPAGRDDAAAEPDATDAPLETIVKSSVRSIEKRRISDALAQAGGNRTVAAKILPAQPAKLAHQTEKIQARRQTSLAVRPVGLGGPGVGSPAAVVTRFWNGGSFQL